MNLGEQSKEKIFAYVTSCKWSERWECWEMSGCVIASEGPVSAIEFAEYEHCLSDEFAEYEHCLSDWQVPECHETGLLVFDGVCSNAGLFVGGHRDDPDFIGEWRRPTAVELWGLRRPLEIETAKNR